MDTLEKEIIDALGRMKQDGMRFAHATQNSIQLKTQCLLLEFSISYFCSMLDDK
jgi:hypothetical protein